MKVAIVHDWLTASGGAEKVLEQMLALYPQADLFSVVDFLPDNERGFLGGKRSHTTFIQHLPFARKRYRLYLALMPLAIEQLDLSAYDLILSSSYAVAKGVLTGPGQMHVSYVHSPMRYAWDLQHQYLRESGLGTGFLGWLARWQLSRLRIWDQRTAHGVDQFIANSQFIARRILKVYGRQAQVIYPPVDIDKFALQERKENYYVTVSRMVPYKRMDLIVEAFRYMPEKKLVVIGTGPDMTKIKKRAGSNVELLGHLPFEVMRHYLQNAKAFIFAAEEDFGIAPVEAQACGTPLIAYGRGGALETVRGLDHREPTGVFFREQSVGALVDAVRQFESNAELFSPLACRQNASRFSANRFRHELGGLISERMGSDRLVALPHAA
jgi:glycosyltransferase involved in cell wall biosynthesis